MGLSPVKLTPSLKVASLVAMTLRPVLLFLLLLISVGCATKEPPVNELAKAAEKKDRKITKAADKESRKVRAAASDTASDTAKSARKLARTMRKRVS